MNKSLFSSFDFKCYLSYMIGVHEAPGVDLTHCCYLNNSNGHGCPMIGDTTCKKLGMDITVTSLSLLRLVLIGLKSTEIPGVSGTAPFFKVVSLLFFGGVKL